MPVVVADEVWRRTVPSPDLDDLVCLVRGADNPSAHVKPVSYNCLHDNLSQSPDNSMYLLASVKEALSASIDRDQTLDRVVATQASTVAGASLTAASCVWV